MHNPSTTEIRTLFSIPIWTKNLDPEFHRKIDSESVDGRTREIKPFLAGIFRACEKGAGELLDSLQVEYSHIEFTNISASINDESSIALTRIREALVGIYIVGADMRLELVFCDPRSQAGPNFPGNPFQPSGEFALEARAGTLVLFPSWLPCKSPDEDIGRRCTLMAFNVLYQ